MKKFIELANHIIAMNDDAYLSCHPEWHEIVNEANEAIKSNSRQINIALLKDNQDNYDKGLITTAEYYEKRFEINGKKWN